VKNFNYKKICFDLLADLTDNQKEIMVRRFGLGKTDKETLEAIGQDFGVCRERVRQIQATGMDKIKPRIQKYEKVFQSIFTYLKCFGGLKREGVLLDELGGSDNKNEVFFLLSLNELFKRLNESNDFYSCWTIDEKCFQSVKKSIDSLYAQFKKRKKLLHIKELKASLKGKSLLAALEASKKIQQNKEGLYGLSIWPEINPRGIKDKAYVVLKNNKKPLHFRAVSELIDNSHVQTVHNELIKDPRFVLVGRGTYALSEWGYYPGHVKDVISSILKGAQRPLTKEELLREVLKQRMVKENTVLLNLNNKNYFLKDDRGRYIIKEV
jgi:hypothetical protein